MGRFLTRRFILEIAGLVCLGLAGLGISGVRSWDWWPFFVIGAFLLFFANLHQLTRFRIGLSGIEAETRQVAQENTRRKPETWKERGRLEFYVLANLSAGNEPHKLPVNQDPALNRLRLLKDAAQDGQLSFQGKTPNAFATVRFDDFLKYAKDQVHEDFSRLAEEWATAQASTKAGVKRARPPEARLQLARLRTDGVALRNRGAMQQTEDWLTETQEWMDAVMSEIELVDPADAEWFRTLDAVPQPRIRHGQLSQDQTKVFRELDFMLVRLEELVSRYALIGDYGYRGDNDRTN